MLTTMIPDCILKKIKLGASPRLEWWNAGMGEAKTQALKNTLFFILFTINSDYSGQDL
jgi:hypothetical protein